MQPLSSNTSLGVMFMAFNALLSIVKHGMEGKLDAISTPVTESQQETYASMQGIVGAMKRWPLQTERWM